MADTRTDSIQEPKGKRRAAVTRHAVVVEGAPAGNAEAREPPTLATVRAWINAEAPRWPELADEELMPIARACELARQEWMTGAVMQRGHGARLEDLKTATKKARDGMNVAIAEMPTLWAEAEGYVPEAVEALWNAEKAMKRLLPYLRARPQGGQTKPWGDLAASISCHLRGVLADLGVKASISKEEAPLPKVVAAAINATYGPGTTNSGAVGAILRRREENSREEVSAKEIEERQRAKNYWCPEAIADRAAARAREAGER